MVHRCTVLERIQLTKCCRTFFGKSLLSFSKEQPAFFMKSEVSLPCSQKLAIRLHPDPHESSSSHLYLSP